MHDWSTTPEPSSRTDAHIVGMCCIHVEDIVAPRTSARMIHVTDGVIQHYRERHAGQFDFSIAEAMLPNVLSDPFRLYQGQKQKTIVFIEVFREQYFLLVPVKCTSHMMWQETLYVVRQDEFESRGWVRRGLLYERQK